MSITTPQAIHNYTVGTWTIDPNHSEVGFSVRHMMVTKVRGRFTEFSGQIVTAENVLESTVTATVVMTSIDTANRDRDADLRSPRFFDADRFPVMTFRSSSLRRHRGDYVLQGDLTLKGTTKPVSLFVEAGGFGSDQDGNVHAGFSATGVINRRDFGVDFNAVLETGGVVVADQVEIQLEIEAVLSR